MAVTRITVRFVTGFEVFRISVEVVANGQGQTMMLIVASGPVSPFTNTIETASA